MVTIPQIKMLRLVAAGTLSEADMGRLSLNPQSGGGTRTYLNYKTVVESPQFCLCITDSDKGHPGDECGDTAERVQATHNELRSPFGRHMILPCHEAENLIPHQVARECYAKSQEREDAVRGIRCLQQSAGDYWKFADLKKGITVRDALSRSEPERTFWTELFAPNANLECKYCKQCELRPCGADDHCPTRLVHAFGDKYLEQCLDYMERNLTPRKINESLSRPVLEAWQMIAREVFSWGFVGCRKSIC
jgi:hypothetical protein